MRCFIAIDIDDTIRADLADLQQQIAERARVRKSDVKWVAPEAMHLTVKFLGETDDRRVVEACGIVGDVAGRHESFDVEIGTVGSFGGRSARILWVGAGLESESLLALQQDMDGRLADAGWAPESRKFSGHLTLCRIRNPKAGVALARIAGEYEDFDLGTTAVEAVTVYQSELTPKGPVYTVLGNFRLSSQCEAQEHERDE